LAKRGSKWKSDKARHAAACLLEGLEGQARLGGGGCEVQGGSRAGVSEVGKGRHQGGGYLPSILPSSQGGEHGTSAANFAALTSGQNGDRVGTGTG
jgi:hypothetical protein